MGITKIFCHTFLLLLFLTNGWNTYAQGPNLGTPPTRNFSKKTYRAGTQNWEAAQDRQGVLYWANNEGLLRYDGVNWTILPVANNTIVRSVAINDAGLIFVGAQSELGYFEPNKRGGLQYHSLVGALPESWRTFEDVWDIAFLNGDVFFRTNRVVFQYSGNRLIPHEPGAELHAMFVAGPELLVQTGLSQLVTFRNGAFVPYAQIPELGSALTASLPWAGDTILFSSLKNGLFYLSGGQFGRWPTAFDQLLRDNRIYHAAALPDYQLALGTSLDGLLVLDRQRRIARHLNNKNGLQNNNILSTFCDRAGNVWLGLDNGIDYLILNAAFTSILPDGDLKGTGYAATVHEGNLYLGVSNGVYAAPWKTFYRPDEEPFFKKIPGSNGQVWSLNTRGNELLMGHHEGAFKLENGALRRLSPLSGAWTFVQLSERYLLGGAYSGLFLYRKTASGWSFERQVEGLTESCRIMVRDDNGAVWISHPYRGLYRVQWSEEQAERVEVQFFNAANGLPSDLNNYVFQIAGKAVFATEKGLYRYDSANNRFAPDAEFNHVLGSPTRLRYLQEDERGNIWFATANEVGILKVDDLGLKKEIRKVVFPELNGKLVGGFEFVYPADESTAIIGAEQGFLLYHTPKRTASDTLLDVVFYHISAAGQRDSVLFGMGNSALQPDETDLGPVLAAGWNNLRFAFSATDYSQPELLQYRTRLVGYDRDWSDWLTETTRVYTNLSAGEYTFEVQARRLGGAESKTLRYSFRIRPPWYSSITAWVFYFFAFISLMGWVLYRQRKKLELEKAELTETHQQKEAQHLLAVEQSKAALTEVQHEKLAAEIQFKNQELASVTMHLVQKGEILLTIQEALNHILEKSTHPAVKKEIQQLLNLLDFDTKLDEDWELFTFRFDQVHVDFLRHLREKYPQLSTSDHKLCAFLRMNLSTKEIAPLLNISVRGVEASRYRLRKKLNLPNEVNLTDFIMSI